MDWFKRTELPKYITDDTLPEIIRDLLLASVTFDQLRDFNFPTENLSGTFGVDGVMELPEDFIHPYIPAGKSQWEMGVDKNTKAKAEDDYRKRSGSDDSTFVFVSPQVFNKADEWIAEKKAEKGYSWGDIKCINRDRLFEWLCDCPAAAIKWAERWGVKPKEAYSLQSVWERWNIACKERLPVALVKALGQRNDLNDEKKAQKFVDWLAGNTSSHFAISSSSVDESRLYLAAIIKSLSEEEREFYFSKLVCVDDDVAYEAYARHSSALIIVTSLQDGEIRNLALKNGHKVCLAMRSSNTYQKVDIKLPIRVPSMLFEKCLNENGFTQREKHQWLNCSQRNLSSLRDALSETPPRWHEQASLPALFAALSVGGWSSEAEYDREVMCLLSGVKKYEDFEEALESILLSDRPPVQREYPYWRVTSAYTAWPVVIGNITDSFLGRYKEACLKILGAKDAAKELPSEKRGFASMYGISNPYSEIIRYSLAESLILFAYALEHCDSSLPARIKRNFIDGVVDEVLSAHEGHWESTAEFLKELAEASPQVFLETVESELAQEEGLTELVPQESHPIFQEHLHAHFLWALEVLAWEPKYLFKVAVILVRLEQRWNNLARNIGNSAASSFQKIFSFWSPQTNASIEDKISILKRVSEKYSRETWLLLLSLLPEPHSMQTPSAHPKWRWEFWEGDVCWNEAGSYLQQIYSICLKRVLGQHSAPEEMFLKLSTEIPSEWRSEFYELIESTSIEQLPGDKFRFWNELRRVIHDHRSFSDADWAFPEDEVNRLVRLYEKLTPQDELKKSTWVFVCSPRGLAGRAVGEYDTSLLDKQATELQQRALKDIYEEMGLEGISKLLHLGPEKRWGNAEEIDPVVLGNAVAKYLLANGEREELIQILENEIAEKTGRQNVINGLMSEFVKSIGDDKLSTGFDDARQQSDSFLVEYLVNIHDRLLLWDKLRELPEQIQQDYWARMSLPHFIEDAHELRIGVEKLLEVNRPLQALHACNYRANLLPFSLVVEVVKATLEFVEDIKKLPARELQQLLERAYQCEDKDEGGLIQLEWQLYPLLRRSKRGGQALHQALAKNPSFFKELISYAFKSSIQEVQEAKGDKSTSALASRAYEVLRGRSSNGGWLLNALRDEDGRIKKEEFTTWITDTRKLCVEEGYIKVADSIIGQELAYSKTDQTDGAWPEVAVRDIFEQDNIESLKSGFLIGWTNKQGVFWGSAVDHYTKLKEDVQSNLDNLKGDYWGTRDLLEELVGWLEDDIQRSAEREKQDDMV